MPGIIKYEVANNRIKPLMLDMTDSYTCSFTEFRPFCINLYYISNFKDFSI